MKCPLFTHLWSKWSLPFATNREFHTHMQARTCQACGKTVYRTVRNSYLVPIDRAVHAIVQPNTI